MRYTHAETPRRDRRGLLRRRAASSSTLDGSPAGAGFGRDRPRKPAATDSAGFSLVEMMIALTVFTVVVAATLSVFSSETEALREGMDRFEVLRNIRFGANAVEKDLKTTGSNVPRSQPDLIYADEDVVAFNADFATNVDGDDEAVYYDPDAPNAEVTALDQDRAITIPNATFTYPQRDYTVGEDDTNSPAETLIFFFRPDSSTDRSDDWALFRQVNDREPELVARRLLQVGGTQPFLEYHRLVTPDNAPDSVVQVAPGNLPMAHQSDVHGPADGEDIDDIRAVRLRMAATNGETGEDEEVRTVSRMVRIPNMGVEQKRVCGETPVAVSAFSATPEVDDGQSTVLLEWDASVDQASGEEDVVRYLVWKRQPSDSEWGPPILALPVGGPTYSYRDTQVVPDEKYEYGVAAQDCTPELSAKTTAGPVQAPNP